MIVEVAVSSASYDLHEKLQMYQRHGVKEYLVWQIYENRLDWFELQQGRYIQVEPDDEGIIHSRVFPGLCLAVDVLLAGDMARVAAVLQQRLQTQEHTAFMQYLTSPDTD